MMLDYDNEISFPGLRAHLRETCSARDLGSIPGLGRSPGEGKGYPLQYSGLENSTDCIVHWIAKSQTQMSDFHFTSLKEMVSRGSRGTVTLNSGLRVKIILHLASSISCEDSSLRLEARNKMNTGVLGFELWFLSLSGNHSRCPC